MKLSEFVQVFLKSGGGYFVECPDPEVEFFLNNDRVELTGIECTVSYPDINLQCGTLAELGNPNMTVNINFEETNVQDT